MTSFNVDGPIARRFKTLSGNRQAKLDRAKKISAMTIPAILPMDGFSENSALILPWSSMAARGCMFLGSKIHAAMMPMNDLPFIDLKPKYGIEISQSAKNLLKNITDITHETLMSGNIRSVFNEAVLHLLITGDVLLFIEPNFDFRLYRLDQYVIIRDVTGCPQEMIVVDWDLIDLPAANTIEATGSLDPNSVTAKAGYVPVYTQLIKKDKHWVVKSERNGQVTKGSDMPGKYDDDKVLKYPVNACPYIPLRWNAIAGENYGRSFCEEIFGDILASEKYTESLNYGMIAASAYWLGVAADAGIDADQFATKPIGSVVRVDFNKVGAISPAKELKPQIDTMLIAVQDVNNRLSKAFLMTGEAIPTGERVTATAVKAVMIELEQVLGGNFSGLGRDLFVPATHYVLSSLLEKGILPEEFKELFHPEDSDNEIIKFDILTGLQAIGKDTDNTKLMQFLEVMRNIPEHIASKINPDTLLEQLIRSFGFPVKDWIIPDEVIMAKQQQLMAAEAEQQAMLQNNKTAGDIATKVAPEIIKGQPIQ